MAHVIVLALVGWDAVSRIEILSLSRCQIELLSLSWSEIILLIYPSPDQNLFYPIHEFDFYPKPDQSFFYSTQEIECYPIICTKYNIIVACQAHPALVKQV